MHDGRTLWVSTDDALYRATPNGAGYQAEAVGLQGKGGARAVVVDVQNPQQMYAATGAAGAWRSLDSGQTWHEINEGIVYKEGWSFRPASRAVTGDPQDPEAFFVGMVNGTVWMSEDGGEHFTQIVDGINSWVRHLLVTH